MTLLIATSVRGASPFSAMVTQGYSESVRRLQRTMKLEEFPFSVTYSCDTVRAHNRIAAHVLREMPDVDRVLWWDDDEWPEEAELVGKMIAKGQDLIGAPYTTKKHPVKWVHRFLPDPPGVHDDMLEVAAVGFGFTMTSRRCLQAMTDDAVSAGDVYIDAPLPHSTANIFGMMYDESSEGRRLLSEDFAFCKRWRRLGGRVMVYAGSGNMMAHTGAYVWTSRDMPGGVVGGGT